MKLYDVHGRLVNHNVAKYSIKWDGKCRSKVQFKVKQFLKPYWQAHIVFEEFPCFGSLLKVDLINFTTKIAVEVNGNQHEHFNKFFHRDNPRNFLQGIKNDQKKYLWLKKNGFTLVEIYEDEIEQLSHLWFQEKFKITL